MKKFVTIIFVFTLSIGSSYAQVGIGTTTPDASAALDVSATNKGFLLPRVANISGVTAPVAGLIIYDISEQCIKYYNGTAWSGCLTDGPSVCGAYVAAGVFKTFMCHNLGATTTLDPNVPVQGIHGNYYQWGRSTVVADTSTPAGAIAGWNTTAAANGSWVDASKTANDPCPAGYRVPTSAQWAGVANGSLNTVSRTGSWANDGNFTTAIHFGPNASSKTLTLPAAGYRGSTAGALSLRGYVGAYWSSTESSTSANNLEFYSSSAGAGTSLRTYGFSVRCVSE